MTKTESERAMAYAASLDIHEAMRQLRTGEYTNRSDVDWVIQQHAILKHFPVVQRFAVLTGLEEDLVKRVLTDAWLCGGPRHASQEETVQVQEALRAVIKNSPAPYTPYASPATGKYETTRQLIMQMMDLVHRLASSSDLFHPEAQV